MSAGGRVSAPTILLLSQLTRMKGIFMSFFDNLPSFPEGIPADKVYNLGCGLADDINNPDTPISEMRLLYNVWGNAFSQWLDACAEKLGVTPTVLDDESGIYAEFSLPEGGIFYAYYVRHSREARFIYDPFSTASADYSDTAKGDGETKLIQYGLYYSNMVRMVTADCGMCYFVILPDKRVIMLDGGEIEQCTAPAIADVMALLHRMTGTEKGEKMTFAAWLCTHAHNDHMDLFSKILHDYPDEIDVQRVIFNFPSANLIDMNECVSRLKQRLGEFAPDAQYMKIHTGQSINICGVEIKALLTHEDIINFNHRRLYDGMNGTTTVFRISANGKAFTVLGDLQDEGAEELSARYNREYLRSAYLQAAHHCINMVNKAYRNIRTDKVLLPAEEARCLARDLHNYNSIRQFNKTENCIFAGNGTDVFLFGESAEPVEHYPVVGGPYDGNAF